MNLGPVAISAEELGIYLSCTQPTLAYNLPLLLPLGSKASFEQAKKALERILEKHPYLDAEFHVDKKGDLTKSIVSHPFELKLETIQVLDKVSLVQPFQLLDAPLYRFRYLRTPEGDYLFCDFHHMLMDGFSLKMFLDEFAAAYEDKSIGEPEAYSGIDDGAKKEAYRQDKEALEEDKKHFLELFDGIDCDSSLIEDKKDPETAYGRIRVNWTKLHDDAVTKALAQYGVRRSSFFLGAYGLALAQATFLDEAFFLTVNNGRDESAKKSFGMYVKTLPMHLKNLGKGDVKEYLAAVDAQQKEAILHSGYSYSDLVSDTGASAEILFSYQGDYYYHTTLNGKDVPVEFVETPDGKEKLAIQVFRSGNDYLVEVEYRADLYEEDIIRAFIRRIEHFALGLLEKARVEEIDPCDEEDKALLASYNEKDTSGYDFDKDFVEVIQHNCETYPDREAIISGDHRITYGQLGDLSDRIADFVMKMGLGKDDVVSILIRRHEYMAIAPMGVMKAGAAYQPLDPGYPDERLSFMTEDADAKLLICDRGLEERVSSYHGPILYIDEIPSLPLLRLPRPKPEGDALYVMLYTSGSTGKPKGVQLERHNLSAFLQYVMKEQEVDENSRYFAYASFGFDANMSDVFSALYAAVPLYIIDEEMRLDLRRLNEYYEENKITHGVMTTQVGRQFTEDYDNHSLVRLLVGGEKLVPIAPPKHFTLVNGYGPTECTVYITSFDVDKEYHRVPIGKGLAINHLYVLDKDMRPLPYGVPGFLFCSGPQVGRGYKNRPEENAKAFLPNPFEGGRYGKMYHTGDVVRFLKDGTVDFIGRKDGQVKIRGFRIEMSEVERVIRDFPGVKDATVNAYPAPSGGLFLAGYVVGDSKLDLEAIKAFVGDRKPYYMVPEVMMQIDKIPLNQNGKVNKRVLPEPKREETAIVAPETEAEKTILAVAKKVLGYDAISVTADLFEAGLTSISSIKFITMVSESTGMDFTIAMLRDAPNIRAIASHVQGNGQEEDAAFLDDYPLTKTQQGIYVECFAHPSSTIYNIPLLYRLSPKLDLARLEEAIKEAINAHPYLKGHLKMGEAGEPRVVPCLQDEVKVERIASECPKPFALTPYDLMKGPFYQARIYQGKENYLFLDTHHIASDGASLAVLLEDIDKAYRGEAIEPERRDGFQIALKELRDATPEELAKQKAHYASFLEGVDCVALPRKEYDLPEKEEPREADVVLSVEKEKIKAFLQENNFGLNGFFNAVFAFALAKWDGNDDALFTSIYSGRDSSFTARSVTMMVKTLPAYAKIEEKQSVLDFVRALSDQIQKSQESVLYSFAEASHDFGVKADVMFAYQGDGFLPHSIGGEEAENIHLNGDEVKALFSVDCVEDPKAFRLHFEYPSNLYLPETMTYFARLFDLVASGFAKGGLLSEVRLIDEATAKEMDVHNETDDEIPYATYLDALAEQVASHPDKPAVIGIDETLTYGQFDARTNQVANALAKLGIGQEDKIVVMVPRIANAYVAREGVLKAGACFVPVDPAYPDERILYIIEDSESKYVLTTRALYEEKKATYGDTKFLILEDILASESNKPLKVSIDPHSLCYCIFTSGSTGKPKGVMIEHHSLANFIANVKHNPIADEYANICSVAASLASLSFDLSIQEEFIPLGNGMSVVIASEDEILNPVLLAKRMKEHHVDIITTTPSYVNNVLDIEDVMEAFRALKVIDLGAEALPASMIAKMREKGMKCLIHNGYGPTEATVACTMDDVVSSRITIGFPISNTKTYIIDGNLRRLPYGAIGELLIGGAGVARGYVHRDDLNKEKFIDFDGVYAYRSGDLARINYDGRIEFFGRKDNQVKLRGLRVELDEIENALQSYPGISHAVVLVKETKEEGQFLVGYYLAKEEFPVASLKEHLGKTLTPYMIPKVFMRLESIPMTNNGKVNKKALPDPVLTKDASKKAARLPRNDTQKALYEIFMHVLGVKELSIDDDFFDLGGTSLSASKVTMLAMEKGLPISYSDVFDNPTVLDLAALCLANGSGQSSAPKEETLETIEEGLEHNICAEVDDILANRMDFHTVLLTGATGFLGIHILHELLVSGDKEVVVLVRGNDKIDASDRLSGLLEYYFDSPFEREMGARVHVVESDVTSPDLIEKLKGVSFDLIINCAAVVKHFSNSDAIERVNLGGLKNLIEVALDHSCRLVQISTLSVAGENVGGKFPESKRIHESEIYFGQAIDNKYINSKIKAEQALIEAVNKRGLDGKIIRVGNLMGRARDGQFQVNSGTNNFMATIRAYKKLGVFPVSLADTTVDFSPIDEVSKTILLLASTDRKFTIFHSANSHEVEYGDVIAAMNAYGYPIALVDDATFMAKLTEYMKDEEKQMDVSCLISYNSSDTVTRDLILSDNTFTIKALYRLGYRWPITEENYLDRSILSLDTLGFFE